MMARDMAVYLELNAEDRASAVLASFEGEIGKLGDSTESLGGVLRKFGVSLDENVNKKLAANEKVLAAASKAYQEGRISASDYDRATLAIAKANDKLQASLKQTGDHVKASSGAFSSLGSFLKDHFVITLGDVSRAVRSVTSVVGSWVSAAAESEDVAKKLGAALASLGPRAAGVAAALQDQASALQKTTRFGDEAIVQGQAFLAAFVKNEDALKRATVAATDFSAALGVDLQTAFELLAKASQGNTATLGRYGIVLDDTIPKAQRFEAVLKLIGEKFGGRAVADAQTFSGAMAQIANAYGELEEAAGKALTQNKQFGEAAGRIKTVLQDEGTVKSVEDLGGAFANLTAKITENLAESARALRAFKEFNDANFEGARAILMNEEAHERLNRARAEDVRKLREVTFEQAGEIRNLSTLATLTGNYGEAMDRLNAARGRDLRISREVSDLQGELVQAARDLGITLDSETTAALVRHEAALAKVKEAQRQGLATAKDVAAAQAALLKAQEEATGKTDGQAQAFRDASTAADAYAAKLRGTMIPALQDTGRQADLSAAAVARVGAVDRSGKPITGAGTFEVGGTRFRPAGSNGSILVGSTGGTYGSQQRNTTTGTKTYIYNPQSGRVEQYG